jgi:sRNA-binding protein
MLPDLQAQPTERARLSDRHFWHDGYDKAILCERFPAVFCLPRVPLAIGIHRQIRARLGNEVTTRPLSAILAWWTKQPDYLEALARGEMRRNLDGSPAVESNEVARQRAAKRLSKKPRETACDEP